MESGSRDKGLVMQDKQPAGGDQDNTLLGAAFMLTATGMSLIMGFSSAIVMTKRKDPAAFQKGSFSLSTRMEAGSALAARALGRATLYTIGGFGAFLFCAWHALGLKNIKDLPQKMKDILPKVPQQRSTGRTEFSSIRELMQYLIDEGKK